MQSKQRHGRVLGYCRVSSEEQADRGTSLDGQREELERWCREHGRERPILYVEVESAGESAREKRVELKRLISDAEPGDTVVTVLVDRWARDVAYTLDVVRKFKRSGVRWVAVEDGIDSDDERGFSDLIRRASEAEIERERIRRRTVGTRQRLRKAGYFVEGHAPLGYRVEKRKLVIDPVGADAVRRIFAMSLAGSSSREIAAVLRAELPSVRGLDHAAMARRLRDRRYIGESNTIGSRRKPLGEWIKTHDPIVDRDTWDAVQESIARRILSGRRGKSTARTASFLARGLIRCAKCGRVVHSWAPESGASVKHAGYYQCVNKCVRARQDEVDAHINALAAKRLEHIRELLTRPQRTEAKPVDIDSERRRLLAKRERIVDAISEGIVSKDTAKAKMGEIEASLDRLDLRKTKPAIADRGDRLRETEALVHAWSAATASERRDVLKRLVDRIQMESTATKKWQRGAWSVLISWRETQ